MELNIPAIKGIGGSAIYLIDRYGDQTIYDVGFIAVGDAERAPAGAGYDYRPSDAQRSPGPHGRMGSVLRALVQLP